MTIVKSLEELMRLREEALEKRRVNSSAGQVQVIVTMGTCGIAAGARDAMKTILDTIETENLTSIIVTQTGCVGLCNCEPIVQVVIGEQPKVTYGKVTSKVARRIMSEHVVMGNVVEDHVIPVWDLSAGV